MMEHIKYRLSSFQYLKAVSFCPSFLYGLMLHQQMYPFHQFHQTSCSFLNMPRAVFFTFARFGSSTKNKLPFPPSVKELFIPHRLSRKLTLLDSWPHAFSSKQAEIQVQDLARCPVPPSSCNSSFLITQMLPVLPLNHLWDLVSLLWHLTYNVNSITSLYTNTSFIIL